MLLVSSMRRYEQFCLRAAVAYAITWGHTSLLAQATTVSNSSGTPVSVASTVTTLSLSTPPAPVTAAEVAFRIQLKAALAFSNISYRQAHYPIDSMHRVLTASAAAWLKQLDPSLMQGMQLDPSGVVSVVAGQEAYAQQQIAKRLATPGLSLNDRAFTYVTAIKAFSDMYYPERLPIAEAYLRDLDAMGPSAGYWQAWARIPLVDTYYLLGRRADVAREGLHALRLTNTMSFIERRDHMFNDDGGEIYAETIDALTADSVGRAQIAPLNQLLRAAAVPQPDNGFVHPILAEQGERNTRELEANIAGNALLGTPGAPIVSNYWLNRPTRDSAVVPMNDGTIHVLEFGSFTCPGCLTALQGLSRVQHRFTSVQTIFCTWTIGYWGNRLAEPDEEAAHLTDFFLNKMHTPVLIALWKGKKVHNDEGGMSPEGNGPNYEHYPFMTKPTIWVLDGRGMIRHVVYGFSREKEEQLAKVIQFLQREHTTASAAISNATNSSTSVSSGR